MPLYYSVSSRLVSANDLFLSRRDLKKYTVSETLTTDKKKSTPTRRLATSGPATPVDFKPVGLGLPMLIELRHVYNGNKSDSWLGKTKDYLITSAVKSFETQDATPRGLNRLASAVRSHTDIGFAATEPGTPIVYYTPAVTTYGTLVTTEVAVDNFPKETVDAISALLRDAGALPVFGAASSYLLGASAIVSIVGTVFENILDRTPYLQETIPVTFDSAGLPNFAAGFYQLVNSADEAQLNAEAVQGQDGKMMQRADPTKAYQGDIPYVTLAIDGRARANLDGFAVKVAQAAVLERFIKAGSAAQSVLQTLGTAMQYYNDSIYRQKIKDIDEQLKRPDLTQEEKDALTKLRDAYVKNIKNKEFLP